MKKTEKLFAEINDQEIKYAVFQSSENLTYNLLTKKNSKNTGIQKGIVVDHEKASELVSRDLKQIDGIELGSVMAPIISSLAISLASLNSISNN